MLKKIASLRTKLTTAGRAEARFEQAIAEGIVSVGRHTYGTPEVLRWADGNGVHLGGKVNIGSFTSIAADVRIFTGGNHSTNAITTFPIHVRFGLPVPDHAHATSRGDVSVGHDVWLGTGCLILSGVTIGTGAVVGAGAVVSKDVRPYAIVAGNPAKEIRRRFDDDKIAQLLSLAWWTWPDDVISGNADVLTDSSRKMDELKPPSSER